MNTQARPQDVLLAYDDDFTGFTSVTEMARPLEPEPAAALPLGRNASGGGDPDGFYDDFTARLGELVRMHPGLRIGGHGDSLDWGAVVVAVNKFGDPEDDSSENDDGDDDDDVDGGDDDDDAGTTGATEVSAGNDSPPVISLRDYTVGTEGGLGKGRRDNLAVEDFSYPGDFESEDDEFTGGGGGDHREMDETDAEALSFGISGGGGDGGYGDGDDDGGDYGDGGYGDGDDDGGDDGDYGDDGTAGDAGELGDTGVSLLSFVENR